MRLPTTLSALVLSCATLWALPTAAQSTEGLQMEALPAPPGPYISSRPKLEEEGANRRMRMPMPPMPTQYMPRPDQFPAPPLRWPMGAN